jgi:uncharacterized protein (DUF983 family)
MTIFPRRLTAILLQRCPACLRAGVFKSLLETHERCPKCGVLFQREEGYFLGAMYVSYAMGGVLVGAVWLLASTLWPDVPPLTLCIYIFLGYIPLMPLLHRMARVVWMHFDWLVCPNDTAAGSYHKSRPR